MNVIPNATVEHVSFKDNQVNLRLNSGEEVRYWYLYFALMLKEKARVLTIYANHLGGNLACKQKYLTIKFDVTGEGDPSHG